MNKLRIQPAARAAIQLLAVIALVATSVACDPKVKVRHSPLNPGPGDTVTFTATASDSDGINFIEIMVNGSVIRRCPSATTCTTTAGPFPSADQSHVSYTARAVDNDGEDGRDGSYSFAVGFPWNGLPLVPARVVNGRTTSQTMDLCFAMDPDYGGDVARYLDDVEDKIFDRFIANEKLGAHRKDVNFYFTTTQVDASNSCAAIPWSLRITGAFCDAWAVLHTTNFGDCTIGNHFSAEGHNTKAFVHETGHGLYGLADEYEGDTSYFMPSPNPNIWQHPPMPFVGYPGGEGMCRLQVNSWGGDPDLCDQFCTNPGFCGSGWWRHTTDSTVMVRGMWDQDWGIPAERRIDWIHHRY
jgi:hypothetical protein